MTKAEIAGIVIFLSQREGPRYPIHNAVELHHDLETQIALVTAYRVGMNYEVMVTFAVHEGSSYEFIRAKAEEIYDKHLVKPVKL
jgi:hypothetical protein